MRRNPFLTAALAGLLSLTALPVLAETSFTILGTRGGPVAVPHRSQPANVLNVDGILSLVDAGDGTAQQLSKMRVMPRDLENVFISHLHGDHFGGLLAILALRLQTDVVKPLQVYGPPGTDDMVAGILAALAPAMEAGYGVGAEPIKPEDLAVAHIIMPGDQLTVGKIEVTTADNTHYSFAPDSPQAGKYHSLSFRFKTPDRTIVYTGDTGPSADVEELAKGADLLIGEVIELDSVIAATRMAVPNMPDDKVNFLKKHLSEHHLLPADLGKLATASGAPELVVTHIAAGLKEDLDAINSGIASTYDGKVTVANDMDKF